MRIPSILLATLSTALLTGTGCMVGDEGDEGVVDGEIIGGTTDYGDPSVVFLRTVLATDASGKPTRLKGCTATLVAPSVLISAAHCFEPTALWNDLLFGTQPDLFQATNGNYATVIRHPQYTGTGENGHDISVVILSRPIYSLPLVRRGPTPPVGGVVRAVGYGADSFAQTGLGTKRQIGLAVSSVTATVNAGYEGHNLCHGDSGGPTFYAGGITAVNDYVDTGDCHGGGHMGRIDINLPFIRTYVPGF